MWFVLFFYAMLKMNGTIFEWMNAKKRISVEKNDTQKHTQR